MPINAVEPFGQARQMDRINARAIINDLESDARGAQSRFPRDSRHAQGNAPARRAIFKSVSDDIGKNLRQLIGIAVYFDGKLWALKLKFHPSLKSQGLQAVACRLDNVI